MRHNLRSVDSDVKRMSTRCCGASDPTPQHVEQATRFQQLTHSGPSRVSTRSPPAFRHFPASYPQAFAQWNQASFLTISALFPHDLHMFSMKDYRAVCVAFFRNDFARNPQLIADAAGEKNGEKKAVDRSVWKSTRDCTGVVARGTIYGGFAQYPALAPPPPKPPPPLSNPPPVGCSAGAFGLVWIAPAICITSS